MSDREYEEKYIGMADREHEEKYIRYVRYRVTMKLEHTKSAESPIRGCSVAQQVHL